MSIIVAICFAWPHIRRHYTIWKLKEYVGVDLKNLPEDEKINVDGLIEILVGSDANHPIYLGLENWLLYRSESRSMSGITYLVQMEPRRMIPGRSFCKIYVIGRWGNVTRSFRFNVGYQARPLNAKLSDSSYGFLCLTVVAHSSFLGETRQFYRLADNHVELLRVERMDGEMHMGHGNSFDLDEKPLDWLNWRQLIASDDELDQLRGLAAFWSYDIHENLGPIDATTLGHLEKLSKANDSWISEEAAAAVKFLKNRRRHSTTVNRK